MIDGSYTFSVEITPDHTGYIGRECPNCEKYFKIKPGTGIDGFSDCYCPYCKRFGASDEFFTQQQIDHAHSVALNKITGDFLGSLKKLEASPRTNQFISIGISVKGNPTPITYYSELELEEHVTCSECSLEYAIYGAFGYCPDCACHNSKQILSANFDIVLKMLDLASTAAKDLESKLVENCLEDAVSVFDGFGRELCANNYPRISFQNLNAAREKLLAQDGFDIAEPFKEEQWLFLLEGFQKRHLLAHRFGIIDTKFIENIGGSNSYMQGRKIQIFPAEVRELVGHLRTLAAHLQASLSENQASSNASHTGDQ